MRQIIEGRVYDTETAEEIGSDSHGYAGDFEWQSETLYRTKNGRYFLEGEGGPMSAYQRPADGGGIVGDHRLITLTEEQAKRWAEVHLLAEQYEAIWTPEEG